MEKKKNVVRWLLLPVLFLLGIFVFGTERAEASIGASTWSTNTTNSSLVQTDSFYGNQLFTYDSSERWCASPAYGSVQVIKYDSQTNARLAGAQFTIYNSSSQAIQVIQSDSRGIAETKTLSNGYYTMRETKAPDGYQLESSLVQFSVFSGQVVCLKKANVPLQAKKGSLKITKRNESGQVLSGAEFNVYNLNNQLLGTITTNTSGVATLENLAYGTYKVVEAKAPEGYELDTTPKYITLSTTSPNGVACLNIYNRKTPKGKIKVVKRDELGSVLAGAEFDVFDSSNQLVGNIKTGSNGIAELSDLAYGTYKLVETKAPDGYELDATPKYATLSRATPNGIACLTIYNKKVVQTGSIEIVKKDEDGNLLAGTEFSIVNSSDVKVGTVTTDNNGVALLENLPYGTYKVIETKATEGYELDAQPREVTISTTNNKVTIEIVNTKIPEPVTGSIKIIKYVKDSQPTIYLKDAVFMVFDAKNQSIGQYTTDANGEILVNDLEPGKYSVLEIEAPEGYEQDNTRYEVEVEVGKVAEVKHPNIEIVKTGGLKIKKFAKDNDGFETDKVIPGVVYKITDSENNEYTETTDANGEILLSKLPAGEVKIQEIEAPNGYILNTDIVTKTIEVGKITEVSLYNQIFAGRGQLVVYLSSDNPNQSLKDIEHKIVSVENQEVFKTIKTNSFGQFTASLPVGEYEIAPVLSRILDTKQDQTQTFKVEKDKLTVICIEI